MKTTAWALFDRIVADAAPEGIHSNPWLRTGPKELVYQPDFATLKLLLAVPLYLKAVTQSGIPALSLDVWVSYELRRAGFDKDATWPRAEHPRIMPKAIANLLAALPVAERQKIQQRLSRKTATKGVVSASANILGKNYFKQVDVLMSDWDTGPEVLISTKRMDSSFGKNAANRVEESYGDAKNLRLRHPLAALGFVYGLRSTILDEAPDTAEWIIDLLHKLGNEDDAYHAVGLLMIDYSNDVAVPEGHDNADEGDDPLVAAGVQEEDEPEAPESTDAFNAEEILAKIPPVNLLFDERAEDIHPARFMATMVQRVLATTPVNRHKEARRRMKDAPLETAKADIPS
ncbi:hypothetical protein [Paeniglutamicibacter sulfureus]|uniref:Uncharacterized protein n=1 Tax=Paeniglutamicibacter sulfureus TaxID=43666 RepID=A0ABU2BJU3_9MICC|nr:hypothetical protein [Paeniglutamicibacter sulfureus]MDR7358921.1 hypothetical protein [Paeniglutamicibacter sulfureus]